VGPRRWLAGLNWKGFAIIVAFSFINALRQNANSRLLWEEPSEWLIDLANSTLSVAVVAVTVIVAVVIAFNRMPWRGSRQIAALVVVIAASSALGTLLFLLWAVLDLSHFRTVRDFGWVVSQFGGTWPRYLLMGLLFAGAYTYFRRKREGAASMRQLQVDRAQLEQRMAEARLTVLQAQIEPHFLFNTLANVKRLYATEPAAASEMLDNLMRYLAIALPQMRQTESTVARETALGQAYLNIQKIRMGRRLEFTVEVPERLRDARIPPMMLLTLVENAIKHGLNPLPQGGYIRISARAIDDNLTIEVSDSGRGFTKTSGIGTGLANLRARLSAQYGAAASLALAPNAPRGVTATITLPNRTEPVSQAGIQ
jgi:sensor histidine kinase YesM